MIINIIVDNLVRIPISKLTEIQLNAIKQQFEYHNAQYYTLQAIGKKMPVYMKKIRSYSTSYDKNYLQLTRGTLPQLRELLDKWDLRYFISDCRIKLEEQNWKLNPSLKLRSYNQRVINELKQYENAILLAPPGSGKTKAMIGLMAEIKQPTLIMVHTGEIYKHWIKELNECLIYDKPIGQITAGKYDIYPITISTIQTLDHLGYRDYETLNKSFGMIIISEVHHISAWTFHKVVNKLSAYYKFGETASAKRKDQKQILFYDTISHNIVEVTDQDMVKENVFMPAIVYPVHLIGFKYNFNNDFVNLVNELTLNETRNNIIADLAVKDAQKHNVLILTGRKEHCKSLYEKISEKVPCHFITSKKSNKQRDKIIKDIRDNKVKVLVATYSLIGEGANIPILDCLHLTTPSHNYELLKQWTGRVRRVFGDKKNAVIRDFIDDDCEYLKHIGKKRIKFYEKMGLAVENVLDKN